MSGLVLVVRIEEGHQRRPSAAQAQIERGWLSLVGRFHVPDPRIIKEGAKGVDRAVGTTIVNDQVLEV